MKTYTLHLDADAAPGDPGVLERAVLVRDGFSWGAFLFTVLWFLAHRLWLAALGVAVLLAAASAGVSALRLAPGPAALALGLVGILVGLEASSLRRWTLARRGRPAVDVVLAGSRDEAERKAFQRWLDRKPAPVAPPVVVAPPAPVGSPRPADPPAASPAAEPPSAPGATLPEPALPGPLHAAVTPPDQETRP